MKKFFKILIVFIAILSISGCAKRSDKTVVKFSSWGSETEISIIKPILKDFEAKNPDIKVEFIHIPNNYFQKLQLLVASNLTPDVMFINNVDGSLFIQNNIFADLGQYLKNYNSISQKDFFPKALDAFKYKGVLYAIPRDVSNLVVYYNKDLFDKFQVPYPDNNWNFDDFLSTAQKLTKDTDGNGKKDVFGIGFETFPLFWTPFLWSNGGGIVSPDLKTVLVDKPESLEAIQFYADLRNKHHVAPTASEAGSAKMTQLFMQGKLAMQINGRWSVPRFRKDVDFRWDIAKFPGGKEGSIVDADASGWAISRTSEHKEEAWRLVKFLASKHVGLEFTESGLIVPARVDVANSNNFLNKSLPPKNSELFVDIIPESIPTPAPENYPEIMDKINAALEPVWNGNKSAKQAINDDLVRKIKELL